MSYTPGPWRFGAHKDRNNIWVILAPYFCESEPCLSGDIEIARLYLQGDFEQQLSNARAMAAAPEMVEVIHDLLEPAYERYQYVLETDTPDEAEVYKETIDQAEALLRRIEGEEEAQ